MKPDFEEMARAWMAQVQGHARPEHWKSLGGELRRAYELGCREGAAVAFGLMGMAEAIRANAPRLVERFYWTSEIDGARYYDCACPGCGVQMKRREASVDEGTDAEWCGVCLG